MARMKNDRPLAIVTADLHLRNHDRIWLLHPELRGDAAFAVEQLCNAMYSLQPKFLILAGDVFDAKEQRGLPLDLASRLLGVAEDEGIVVLFVTGQHEQMPANEPQILSAIGAAAHINRRASAGDGICFAGLDYYPPSKVEAALRTAPTGDVLVTHQVWKEFMGDRFGCASASWIEHPYKLIITGDYHVAVDTVWYNANNEPMNVVSPGPLFMQSISESEDKSLVLLYDDLTTERYPIRTRTVRRYMGDLTTKSVKKLAKNGLLDELCAADEALPVFTHDTGERLCRPEEISKPILILQHTSTESRPDVKLLNELTKGRAFPFIKGADAKDDSDASTVVRGIDLGDVQAMFRQALRDVCGADERLYADTVAVVDADEPAAELQRVFDEEYAAVLEGMGAGYEAA